MSIYKVGDRVLVNVDDCEPTVPRFIIKSWENIKNTRGTIINTDGWEFIVKSDDGVLFSFYSTTRDKVHPCIKKMYNMEPIKRNKKLVL